MRDFIYNYAFKIDELSHSLHISSTFICLAADVTVGWGPSAIDWDDSPRSVKKFFKWYWNGRCYNCYGDGYMHMLYPEEKDIPCEACKTTGKLEYNF